MINGTRAPTSNSEPCFGPLALLAEMVAMIAPENDNRVLAQTLLVQFGEHAADVPIGPGHRRPVGADHLAGLVSPWPGG